MQGDMHKVNAGHLKRSAYLYIRQSTPRQVLENTESTKRQYALRQRAIALGWHADRIVLIDNDLGHSAALAADPDREGFQKLVAEVGVGHTGLVIGLEVSRLARKSSDGTTCWRSAPSPRPSSSMRRASTILLTLMIGFCSG